MVDNLTLFKGGIDNLVKENTYYFKDMPYHNNLVGRKYRGTSDEVSVFTKYDDHKMPRYITRFRLTKDGDHLNVVDTEPHPPGKYGPLFVKEHVKEQRGGKTRRATSGMQRCESAYCGKTFQQLSEKMTIKMGKTFKMPKEAVNRMLQTMQSKTQRARLKKVCMKGYCNPDCKDNLFQDGTNAPSAVYKSLKGTAKVKAIVKSIIDASRKKIFGKKKSVLKNSFYNKLPAKNVTRARKQGALSGCTIKILT